MMLRYERQPVSRRRFLQIAAAVTAAFVGSAGPSARLAAVVDHESVAQTQETAPTSDKLPAVVPQELEELMGYASALEFSQQFFSEHPTAAPVRIGWVDVSLITARLDFTAIDLENSALFTTSEPQHGAAAVCAAISAHANFSMSAIMPVSADAAAPPPGLLQPEYAELVFCSISETPSVIGPSELLRTAAAIRYLVDQNVTCIGLIPTIRMDQFLSAAGDTALAEFDAAVVYAAEHDVLLVLPGGNANTNLAEVQATQKRILHEEVAAGQYPNMITAGGCSATGERAVWEETKGSNYGVSPNGVAYNTFVTPAVARQVPSTGRSGKQWVSGTTMSTGDVVAVAGLVAAMRQERAAKRPTYQQVLNLLKQSVTPCSHELAEHGILNAQKAVTLAAM